MFDIKKFAFTLSETLLTLTIIGIIAAITIPITYGNYHEKIVVTQVKKFHKSMNELLQEAINDNYGYTIDEWKYTKDQPETLVKYFRPYLSILKDCGTGDGCSYNGNYKLLNGDPWGNYTSDGRYYKMILNDGAHMWLRTEINSTDDKKCVQNECGWTGVACGFMWYDINGEKKPNTIGKDIFTFAILKDQIAPCISDNCNKDGAGWGCSGKAIAHEKLYR